MDFETLNDAGRSLVFEVTKIVRKSFMEPDQPLDLCAYHKASDAFILALGKKNDGND